MKMISPHMKELKSLKVKPVPKYFSEFFIDENLTRAEEKPKSARPEIMSGNISAIPMRPYSSGFKSLAINILPIAEMAVANKLALESRRLPENTLLPTDPMLFYRERDESCR